MSAPADIAPPRLPLHARRPGARLADHLAPLAGSPSVRLIVQRLLTAIPVLLGVTFLSAALLNLLPGDAASQLLGLGATPQEARALSAKLHLNQPFLVRYWHWLTGVLQGNLGTSLSSSRPVSAELGERIPVTFELVVYAMVLALVISIPVALLAARRPGGVVDRAVTVVAVSGLSIAPFILALLLVLLFADTWSVLPALGYAPLSQGIGPNLRFLTLPALALGLPFACFYVRVLRADMLDALASQDYIVAARAKGIGEWGVLTRHALRNSAFGLLTVAGLNVGVLVGGTVIVESVFDLPGLGGQLLTAISDRDIPVVEGTVLVYAAVVVAANLLTDLLYGVLDPRVRHGRSVA